MRCAITGGSGFIGSHVVDKLIDAGYEVVVIDYKVKPYQEDVEFRDVDVVDFPSVLDATEGCDYVFHLAAVSNVNQAFEKPIRSVKVNTLGTVNILEAARQNKVKRVIFASTVWVYTGSRGNNVSEDSPFYMPGAGHIYSSSKIASEFFIHDYWQLYKQPFTILRYGIPYGPRVRKELVIPIFLRKAFNSEPLTISGDGSQYRNFIYVEDLAEAHVLVIKNRKAENQIFNLEGIRRVTVREIAETIKKLFDGNAKIVYTPARSGDYAGKEVSNEKAKKILGWEPKIDFEEGMRRTIKWYCEKHNLEYPATP